MVFDAEYSTRLTIGDLELEINYSADEDGLEIDSVYRVEAQSEFITNVKRDYDSERKYQEAIWVAVQKDYKDMCDPETFQ